MHVITWYRWQGGLPATEQVSSLRVFDGMAHAQEWQGPALDALAAWLGEDAPGAWSRGWRSATRCSASWRCSPARPRAAATRRSRACWSPSSASCAPRPRSRCARPRGLRGQAVPSLKRVVRSRLLERRRPPLHACSMSGAMCAGVSSCWADRCAGAVTCGRTRASWLRATH